MHNPYSGSLPPIRRRRELLGREKAAQLLERRIRARQNTAIMGPEGVGKSSLLGSFFDYAARIRMAQEQLLVARITLDAQLDSEQVYHSLADAIVSALDVLAEVPGAPLEALRRAVEEKRSNASGFSRLQETCRAIDDRGYDIFLVIDDFENFTSSPDINMEHHNLMLTLFRSNLTYFVVATNYDFKKDSLPPKVSGSFFLQAFSGNELLLEGLDEESCAEVLWAQDPGRRFSRADAAMLRSLTGGNPALLRLAAREAWALKQDGEDLDEAAMDAVQDLLYHNEQVRRYMTRWCRLLTEHQVAAINQLLRDDNALGIVTGDAKIGAAQALQARGLLVPFTRGNGGMDVQDCYRFNSIVLEDYCYNHTLEASDPHDVQRQNVTDQLRIMVESGQAPQVLELLQGICRGLGNVTLPVSFDGELTDEQLQLFALNRGLLEGFSPSVREQIETGIRVERTFLQVKMKDYAPVYISFAKAIEDHLNRTVVPVIKRVAPNHLLNNKPLSSYTATLMMGQLHSVLTYFHGALGTSIHQEAADYCTDRGLTGFDRAWWLELTNKLDAVKEIRNDMPHIKPLSGEDGRKLLRVLFQGEDAFMGLCEQLRAAMEQAQEEAPAAPVLAVGAVLEGTVKKVFDRHAFVDVGLPKDGYLHISEISYSYISDIDHVLWEGKPIRVEVLSIEPDGRFKVSSKNISQT